VVTFSGTVRDHAPGRPGVTALTYEAWVGAARQRLAAVVDGTRARWPDVRRVAAIHRVGRIEVGDVAVVVAASSAHRETAFAAAAYCIDTVKATVPLWKKETWSGGEEWGTDAQPIIDPPVAARVGEP
jgi:molybdopterin synthase catalytic subunit